IVSCIISFSRCQRQRRLSQRVKLTCRKPVSCKDHNFVVVQVLAPHVSLRGIPTEKQLAIAPAEVRHNHSKLCLAVRQRRQTPQGVDPRYSSRVIHRMRIDKVPSVGGAIKLRITKSYDRLAWSGQRRSRPLIEQRRSRKTYRKRPLANHPRRISEIISF